MIKKLLRRKVEKEQSKDDVVYLKELQEILLEDGENVLSEVECVVSTNSKLVEKIGGEIKLYEYNEFLAKKISVALDEIDKNKITLSKYYKKKIRTKELIELTHKIIKLRKSVNVLKEYNCRLREETILNNLNK